ncbi:hypothetical protein [Luteimicrobium sp. DT211]|uniref:hypothetical protein n=1 Tax=Luteimicrobium sp. DT211 TaxID=3393412 RepID=UPI003CF9E329
MTTANLHPSPAARPATDAHAALPVREPARPAAARRRRALDPRRTVRRLGGWLADDARRGAGISARLDAARTTDERRFLERP